uniref:Uncharacterized protein n=1 Tax=Streptococcus agalactiae TaxID=1311 RepID=S4WBP2_STRAG|nr:hypothetical protein TnGBS2.4_25 [Streptococcus agalactiae]
MVLYHQLLSHQKSCLSFFVIWCIISQFKKVLYLKNNLVIHINPPIDTFVVNGEDNIHLPISHILFQTNFLKRAPVRVSYLDFHQIAYYGIYEPYSNHYLYFFQTENDYLLSLWVGNFDYKKSSLCSPYFSKPK